MEFFSIENVSSLLYYKKNLAAIIEVCLTSSIRIVVPSIKYSGHDRWCSLGVHANFGVGAVGGDAVLDGPLR